MTRLGPPVCWVVLSRLPAERLQALVQQDWRDQFATVIDPPPWIVVAGELGYSALVSSSPGTEGADWRLAERISQLAPDQPVYSLWLDPERREVFCWQRGQRCDPSQADPVTLAGQLGFTVVEPSRPRTIRSVLVVEGAGRAQVEQAVADSGGEDWVECRTNRRGVLVSARGDGSLGTVPWQLSELLGTSVLYVVQLDQDSDWFAVVILRNGQEASRYESPEDPDRLADVLGVRKLSQLIEYLDIPAGLLRRSLPS